MRQQLKKPNKQDFSLIVLLVSVLWLPASRMASQSKESGREAHAWCEGGTRLVCKWQSDGAASVLFLACRRAPNGELVPPYAAFPDVQCFCLATVLFCHGV